VANQEAHDEANRLYEEMMTNTVPADDGDDGGAIAELAMEKDYEHYSLLWAVQCATLNLYSAAMYHLFEQHVVDLVVEVVDHAGMAEVKPNEAIDFVRDEVGANIRTLPSWPLVNELRLVANAVKHGEGHSADELHGLRPDLFQMPLLRNRDVGHFRMRVRKPLFGEDIFVTTDDFQKYHAASVSRVSATVS
jgi:hypothetical protein